MLPIDCAKLAGCADNDGTTTMQTLVDFWSFRDPNVLWVVLGAVLLGGSCGMVGCFAFLQKRSLVGDALAHAALPGVTSMFLMLQSRDPLSVLIGATTSCVLGYAAVEYLVHHTKVKEDSALAIVLSFFFAVGVFQLSLIQQIPTASQAGLDKIFFGQAASLVRRDVLILGSVALLVMVTVASLYRPLRLITFDPNFARTIGLPIRWYQFIISALIVLSVVVGLQLVGVVLLAAVLLTPAAAARYWTNSLAKMMALAAFFGALAGVFGAQLSYLAPRMPTGPWMIVGVTALFFLSVLLAPQRGMLSRLLTRRRTRARINEENVLRSLYRVAEENLGVLDPVPQSDLLRHRRLSPNQLDQIVDSLSARGEIVRKGSGILLTSLGIQRAQRVTRIHRLWELYLTKRLNIAADHVHDDAEEIEHIITPELEAALLAELQGEIRDPHGRIIPRAAPPKE